MHAVSRYSSPLILIAHHFGGYDRDAAPINNNALMMAVGFDFSQHDVYINDALIRRRAINFNTASTRLYFMPRR